MCVCLGCVCVWGVYPGVCVCPGGVCIGVCVQKVVHNHIQAHPPRPSGTPHPGPRGRHPWTQRQTSLPPPPEWLTYAWESITLPQTSFAGGKNNLKTTPINLTIPHIYARNKNQSEEVIIRHCCKLLSKYMYITNTGTTK